MEKFWHARYFRIALLALPFIVSGCSDAPSPDAPWLNWATNQAGKQEWLGSAYETRADCLFATRNAVERNKDYAPYKNPFGCAYYGYQNAYVQWLVNWVLERGKYKCIARSITANSKNKEPRYSPVLSDFPDGQGNDWYCVI